MQDFRSENGLYSLIQAQFERAAADPSADATDESAEFDISDRPVKRRRISDDPVPCTGGPASRPQIPPTENSLNLDEKSPSSQAKPDGGVNGNDPRPDADPVLKPELGIPSDQTQLPAARPSFPRHLTECSARSSTSQDSIFSGPQSSATSTQTEETTRSLERRAASSTPRRTLLLGETVVSSPLSSPPPILFDPYENNGHEAQGSSDPSSECSDSSDTEDTQRSLDFLSSQTANPSLRNMKGRDLFDCNIWADPLKTSVFYRFATSLRQRVKEVQPTTTHHFIAQLRDLGKLARVYTQNIDEIEKKIGLSTDLRNGAGNRRRKSAKQQPLADPEKDTNETSDQCKNEDESPPNGKIDASQPSTQSSEEADRIKPRRGLSPDRGVECVFLHGSLHSLRCFVCGKLCDWDEDNRESRTLSGEQPECPHCAGATAARQEKGKRALGVGKLRPDIVLYGEEHPQSDLISPIVQHDLSAGPDLLLVLGTSLRVHGLKVMVKEFAKAVHNKGGKVVFINFTKPSESVWGDSIDYWIQWDCDAWVTDLKDRKPHLWLSPEEIQELEKQKRESLAEKRRENMLKRESTGDNRRQTIDRIPPKNPSAMRNDYGCGAYVVYDIFQSLAKIGDRPFDNLGYVPSALPEPPAQMLRQGTSAPAEASKAKPAKAKKPRKSAPAVLSSRLDLQPGEQPIVDDESRFGHEIEDKDVQPVGEGAETTPPSTQTGPETKKPTKQAKTRAKKSTGSTGTDTANSTSMTSKGKKSSTGKSGREAKKPIGQPGPWKRKLISETPIPPPKIPLMLSRAQQPPQYQSRQPQPQPQHQPQQHPAQPEPQSQSQSQPQPRPPPAEEEQEGSTPLQSESTSISAAVKSHPRRRKRKEIFEGTSVIKPTPPKPRRNASRPTSMPPPSALSPSADTPQAEQIIVDPNMPPQEGITLPPIRSGLEVSTSAMKCLEPTPVVSPPSPLAYAPPTMPRPFLYPFYSHPMLYSDPLVRLHYGADFLRDTRGPRTGDRRPAQAGVGGAEATPSPSDQLQREHWEAAASLMTLGTAP